jgi:hypothetical protein
MLSGSLNAKVGQATTQLLHFRFISAQTHAANLQEVTRKNQGNYALRGNHNKQGPFSESGARIWGAQVKG